MKLFTNGVISVKSNFLVDNTQLRLLCDAPSFLDFKKIFDEIPFVDVENDDYDKFFSDKEKSLYEFIKQTSPSKETSLFFLLPVDYDNVLNVLKGGLQGITFNPLKVGNYSHDDIQNNLKSKDFSGFCDKELEDTIRQSLEIRNLIYDEPALFDSFFKIKKYERLKNTFTKGVFKELTNIILDIENLSIVLRSGEKDLTFVPFGNLNLETLKQIQNKDRFLEISPLYEKIIKAVKQKDYLKFEKIKTKIIVDFLKPKTYDFDTIFPYLYYVYKYLDDLQNLRIVYNAKKEGIKVNLLELLEI